MDSPRRTRAPAPTLAEDPLASLELASVGVMHVAERGRLLYVNPWLCRLLGYEREELLQRTVKDISHPDDRNSTDELRAKLRAGDIRSFHFEKRYVRKDGRAVWVSIDGAVRRSDDGRPLYDVAVVQDISARKRAEADLQRSEARFRSLTALSSDWYWEQDAELRFTGFGGNPLPGVPRDAETFLLGKRPWEIPGVAIDAFDLAQHQARLMRREPFRNLEYAYLGRDGAVYDISVSGEPLFDAAGRFTGYHGTSRNITAQKRAERATLRLSRMFAALSATNEAILHARSAEELYRRVCDAAVDGGKFLTTAVLEPAGEGFARVTAASGAAAESLRAATIGLAPGTAEGRGLAGTAFQTRQPCISNDFAADPRTAPWRERAESEGIAAGAAIPLLRDGGVAGVVLFYSTEKQAFDAEIVRLLERMAENIVFGLDNLAHEAERRRAEERVHYLASHDSLTGLPNRAMFAQLLANAIEGGRRYKRSFALLFLDLDGFKVVNDTLGHQGGDELLQQVARRLRKAVRASDVVARLAGDEFVVLLQEVADADHASTVARKILAGLAEPLQTAGRDLAISASVGVAMFPEHADDDAGLLRCADVAMYAAKQRGKNAFRVYSPELRPAT